MTVDKKIIRKISLNLSASPNRQLSAQRSPHSFHRVHNGGGASVNGFVASPPPVGTLLSHRPVLSHFGLAFDASVHKPLLSANSIPGSYSEPVISMSRGPCPWSSRRRSCSCRRSRCKPSRRSSPPTPPPLTDHWPDSPKPAAYTAQSSCRLPPPPPVPSCSTGPA